MARIIPLVRGAFVAVIGFSWACIGQAQNPNDLKPSVLTVSEPLRSEIARPKTVGPYGVSAQSPDPLLSLEPYSLERHDTTVGWYAILNIALVKPQITNRITSGTAIAPAFTDPVSVPVAELNRTISPRFELGYRFPDGRGDVRLGYHFLATSGNESSAGNGSRSRLDFNVFDLDYVSSEWLAENRFGPFRDLRLAFGVRLATAYLDSSTFGRAIENRFSSHFVGAGPHFGLEWSKPLFSYPIEFYTRFDSAGLLGRTQQNFGTSVRNETGLISDVARRDPSMSNAATVVSTELGFAWRLDRIGHSRVIAGYQFEQWWNLGRTDDSNFELSVRGVFLRAEWRY